MKPLEEWKDIVGYEGLYQVSNFGRVRSFKWKREYILKQFSDTKGYLRVALYKNKTCKRRFVHLIMMESFFPVFDKTLQINHKDGCKYNNVLNNLEWVTPSQNVRHAIANGLKPKQYGEDIGTHKLTNEDVLSIRNEYSRGVRGKGYKTLGKKYKVSPRTIKFIVSGETWKEVS